MVSVEKIHIQSAQMYQDNIFVKKVIDRNMLKVIFKIELQCVIKQTTMCIIK